MWKEVTITIHDLNVGCNWDAFPPDEKRKARALERLTLLRKQEKKELTFRAKVVEEEGELFWHK